jgi:hypothetical protein
LIVVFAAEAHHLASIDYNSTIAAMRSILAGCRDGRMKTLTKRRNI